MLCNEAANQEMLKLIRVEQRKQIIAMQQKECLVCDGTGSDDEGRCRCQFITEEEYIAEMYKQKSENINQGEKNDE